MTQTAHASLKLNGFTLDEGIQKLMDAYLAHEAKGDTAVPADHPVLERQVRLTDGTEGIEKIVKDTLGKASRLDPHNQADVAKADSLIRDLAYEVAVIRKYTGKKEEMDSEDVIRYLGEAGTAMGDSTVGNIVELKKSILNMSALKPGHPLYDRNSPVAHLIQYITTQKDDESRLTQHIQTLLQQHATNPKYILATQKAVGHATGKLYGPDAGIPDMILDLREAGELQAQQFARQKSKTYTAPTHAVH